MLFTWCFSSNRGTPKSSILMGFCIVNHPFIGTPIYGNPDIHPPKWTCSQSNVRIAADSQGFDLSFGFNWIPHSFSTKSGPWKPERCQFQSGSEWSTVRFWSTLCSIDSGWTVSIHQLRISYEFWDVSLYWAWIHPKNPRYAQTNQFEFSGTWFGLSSFSPWKKNILGVYLPRVRKKSRSIKTRFHIPFYSHSIPTKIKWYYHCQLLLKKSHVFPGALLSRLPFTFPKVSKTHPKPPRSASEADCKLLESTIWRFPEIGVPLNHPL